MEFREAFSRSMNRGSQCGRCLVFVIMLVASQGASAQLSRVDSLLASSISAMLPAVSGGAPLVTGDSSLAPLLASVPKPSSAASPIFYVSQLSALVQHTDSGARMDIAIQGRLLQPANSIAMPCSLSRSVLLQLTPRDWQQLEANANRYARLDTPSDGGGFWDKTLEPVLVVVGAIAVVALFFLIRN